MPLRPPLLALLALLVAPPAAAQADAPAQLVVMNLAAHPDDEDGLTMAYYRHVRDAVVYSVVFTRGEGGQNEIGPDLYERLGAIRTAETEAAARRLGTQVHYLNFYDFGFTKWAAEAFAEWSRPRRGFWDTGAPAVSAEAGRDTVTARLVHLIRRLRPDVIFTNHDTLTVGARRQHGQHQAVGISAWDAFALAADPAYHPEQLAEPGVALWQPQRLFVRQREAPGADAAVPVGAPCGVGDRPEVPCADLAVRAAMLHRSQGFDLLAPRFFRRDTTYFTLYRAADGAPRLPAGAADLAAGLTPRGGAPTQVAYLLDSGRLPPLPPRGPVEPAVVVPGQVVPFGRPGGGARWTANLFGAAGWRPLRPGVPPPAAPDLLVAPGARPTTPAHVFQYDRQTSTPPAYAYLEVGPVGASVRYGGHLPFEVAPPVVVDLAPQPVRLVRGANVLPVAVRTYDPAARAVRVTLRVERPAGARGGAPAVLYTSTQTIAPSDTATVFRFTLGGSEAPGPARVVVEAAARPTSAPAAPYVETRPAALLPDVRVAPGLRVGLVRTYDDTTERALRALGAEVVLLDSAALAAGRFDELDTVMLDIRAYLARPDLRAHNDRLLDWVRRGGHLVVGYNKTLEWNPGLPDPTRPEGDGATNPAAGFAPYPLTLSNARVVREDAPVTTLQPGHPLFHAPHAIAAADWAGWVQERGLYFPTDYDARYEELVAMSDPGEAPLRSGLLLARVGAGTYLYSPLVWYRQLEALNPGAWRLFANLVSLPRTDGRPSGNPVE